MRSSMTTILALALSLAVGGCGGKGPEQTAIEFARALTAGDVETAMSYMSSEFDVFGRDEVAAALTMAADEARQQGESDRNVRFAVLSTDVNERGDAAVVVLVNDAGEAMEFALIREDDEWKISLGDP